jgi:hypothetical protein
MTPIEAQGFDQLAAALAQATEIATPLAARAVGESLQAIQLVMAPYPNQPDRDRARKAGDPSPYNTYVRGTGQFPRSAFRKVKGVWQRKLKGAYKPGPKGGTVRRTSQNMDKQWRITVTTGGDGVTGELRNGATYSGYVMGWQSGDPQQVAYHAATGWVNADDGIAQAQPQIDAAFDAAIDQIFTQIQGA